jgi:hypothetical protein
MTAGRRTGNCRVILSVFHFGRFPFFADTRMFQGNCRILKTGTENKAYAAFRQRKYGI